MGGFGSGRWGWHTPKRTVEGGRTLDLGDLLRRQPVEPGRAGQVTWSRAGRVAASVGYVIVPGPAVRLSYTWTPGWGAVTPQATEYDVHLVPGTVPNGGRRWWGVCPLAVTGVPCGRRVGRLYLPAGSRYFGCRACHRLTYRCCREHDKRVSRLARNFPALLQLAEHPTGLPVGQLGVVLQALTLWERRSERQMARFAKKSGRTDD